MLGGPLRGRAAAGSHYLYVFDEMKCELPDRRDSILDPYLRRDISKFRYAYKPALTNATLVARPFVVQDFTEVPHINPAPARRALDEVLQLVLGSPPSRSPMIGLGDFIDASSAARSWSGCCGPRPPRPGRPPAPVSRPR